MTELVIILLVMVLIQMLVLRSMHRDAQDIMDILEKLLGNKK